MPQHLSRLPPLAAFAMAIPAVLLASACSTPSSPPEQTSASNPSVTYVYHGDAELIKANQQAQLFCDPYQGLPHAVSISPTEDGGKRAVFECVKTPPTAFLAPASSYLSASYQTDQEFLNASRNARLYCLNSGLRGLTTSIQPNPLGGNTVTFQCSAI